MVRGVAGYLSRQTGATSKNYFDEDQLYLAGGGRTSSTMAYTHDCPPRGAATVSPAATRTRTLALTLTRTRTRTTF